MWQWKLIQVSKVSAIKYIVIYVKYNKCHCYLYKELLFKLEAKVALILDMVILIMSLLALSLYHNTIIKEIRNF